MERCVKNKLDGILKIRISGIVNIKDISNHYVAIANDKTLSDRLNILTDCRETKLNISPEELNGYSKFTKKVFGRFNYIKEAIIVDKPYETAIAILLGKTLSILNNHLIGIFSTEKAATNWLAHQ